MTKQSEYTTVGESYKAWESFWNKFPSQAAIDKWNREVDENGGIHPSQEHWEKRAKEVPSTPVVDGKVDVTYTYDYSHIEKRTTNESME